MTLLKEIAAELLAMFVGDARLTFAVLAIVAGSAAVIDLTSADPLVGGGMLLVGCLGLLLENVLRSARSRDKR